MLQMGLNVRRNTKKIKMDDFLPTFATIKKDKDAGSFEDFVEILKLYDKAENGTIMYAELEHILCSLGKYQLCNSASEYTINALSCEIYKNFLIQDVP